MQTEEQLDQGVDTAVEDDDKIRFNWNMIGTALFCLFLAGGLFLFIRNNELLAHGGRNLWHVEALVMLGVLGIPFVLTLLHLVRHLRRQS